MNEGRITHYHGELSASTDWDDPVWLSTSPLLVDQFRVHSNSHRPRTTVRLLYDQKHLAVLFHVEDRYVRAVRTTGDPAICKDSCVEFFVEPQPHRGYMNFEWNCGGALLSQHYASPGAEPVNLALSIPVRHSLPEIVSPEITEPTTWRLLAIMPFALFTERVGAPVPHPGDAWRGNFYKCGGHTSHPHWASTFPLDERGNFHNPAAFGLLVFE